MPGRWKRDEERPEKLDDPGARLARQEGLCGPAEAPQVRETRGGRSPQETHGRNRTVADRNPHRCGSAAARLSRRFYGPLVHTTSRCYLPA
jgi:hypothetical protein